MGHRTKVIALLGWCLSMPGVGEPTTKTTPDLDLERIGSEMHVFLSAIEPFGFHGAVLVAKDGRILLHEGYGLADEVNASPITAETIFDTGSLTKTFTAAAILELETRQKLSVRDRLSRFLEVPEDKAEITLHHLLTHSAGLTSSFGGDYEQVDQEQFERRALSAPLEALPGQAFAYSNAGYSLLASVIERVSGESWETFVRARLLEPAGLLDTGYELPGVQPTRVAHFRRTESPYPSPLDRPETRWNLLGNGGLLSTVADLYRWHLVLRDNTVLPAEAVNKMETPHVPWPGREEVHYGYGWEVAKTSRGTTVVRHSGGSGEGANGVLQRFVEEDAVLIVLCSDFIYNVPAIFVVPGLLEQRLFGVPLPEVPETAHTSPVEPYVGRYRLTGGPVFEVSAAGSGIGIKRVGSKEENGAGTATLPLPDTHLRVFVPAAAEGGFVFYDVIKDVTARLRFEQDASRGRMSLVVRSGEQEVHLWAEDEIPSP